MKRQPDLPARLVVNALCRARPRYGIVARNARAGKKRRGGGLHAHGSQRVKRIGFHAHAHCFHGKRNIADNVERACGSVPCGRSGSAKMRAAHLRYADKTAQIFSQKIQLFELGVFEPEHGKTQGCRTIDERGRNQARKRKGKGAPLRLAAEPDGNAAQKLRVGQQFGAAPRERFYVAAFAARELYRLHGERAVAGHERAQRHLD